MKIQDISITVLAILCAAFSGASVQNPSEIVLTHANLIDGVAATIHPDVAVVLGEGRILAISPAGKVDVPPGSQILDLKGKYLLPGLIDAHVHLNDVSQARVALMNGVTTARNLGSAHFSDVGLRELAKSGAIDAPEVLACGYHVRPNLAPQFFLDVPELASLMQGVKGPENARRVVAAMLARNVNQIKINATERAGTPETDPRKRLWTDEELAAIVDEAGKRNIPVAAHAHGDEGAYAAVKAGVRSIEHGTYISDTTLALMKEKGTYLVPTIAVVTDLIDPGGQYDHAALQARGRAMLPRIREVAARAHKMGIKVVAATDGGYGPQSWLRLQHEIEELTKVGLTNIAAIQSATSMAAELLGISSRAGTVKVGMEADMIVVERNPVEDIVALQDVVLVVNNGKIVLNRLTW